MSSSTRYSTILVGILILVSAVFSILRMNTFQVGAWVDDAHYEVMAEGFATGHGPRLINFPDKPIEPNFVFGWALLLSPFAALFPGNYDAMKILSMLFWLASIPLAYRLLLPRVKSPYAELILVLFALNPAPIGHAGMLMAETAYVFFTLLCLVLADRWWNKTGGKVSWALVFVALCAVASWQMRTVGLSMMAALPIFLFLKRRFPAAGVALLVVGICFGLQALFNAQTNRSIVYDLYEAPAAAEAADTGSAIQTKISQMLQNVQDYSNEMIANLLVPVFGGGLSNTLSRVGLGFIPGILNLLILAMIFLGFFLSLRDFQLSEIYIVFYAGALLTYWWEAENNGAYARFLIPLVPFLWFYIFQAALWIIKRLPAPVKRFELVGLTAAVVVIGGIMVVRNITAPNDPTSNHITDLSVGASWAKENTPDDTIIMTAEPISRYLYARRSTIDFPPPGQELPEYLEANGVDYILLGPIIEYGEEKPPTEWPQYATSTVLPYIEANPDNFELAFSDDEHNVQVYRVLPAAAT